MAYNYYQTQTPGWGTSQFQYPSPPRPGFQPQPSWRGYDFYNAHAQNPDPGLFDSIMSRMREVLGLGISHSDARHWHRKLYSGLVPLPQVLPADIGAAAAYEAYRTWKHNSFLYEPLSADRERQREGLIGMAIAETQRLWQYSGRGMDTFGLRGACEAAAAAGSVLADRLFASSGGFGRASSYASSDHGYDDPYIRHGGRSRRNSFSTPSVVRVGGSPLLGSPGLPYGGSMNSGASPMPIPGVTISAGTPYGAGMPGSYGAYGSPYGGSAQAQAGLPGSYPYGSGMVPGNVSPNPYAAAATSAAQYTYNGLPVGGYGAGVPQYGAATSSSYTLPNGQPVPPGSTVIVTHPHRSRRHSHSSHSSSGHRHHHHDDYYEREERERGREREERDWERADRERHQRERLRWETERGRYGADDYGRYGAVGSSGYSSGYGSHY